MSILEAKNMGILASSAITAISTLTAVFLTSRFNLNLAKLNIDAQEIQKEKERKLEKIEELYFLFEKWETNFTNIYLTHLNCYAGKLEYTRVLEITKDFNMLAPGDAQRLKMLMSIYFPILENDYNLVEEARAKVAPFILSDGKDGKYNGDDFIKAQTQFESACKQFKSVVSKFAQEL